MELKIAYLKQFQSNVNTQARQILEKCKKELKELKQNP